jgi:dodecin
MRKPHRRHGSRLARENDMEDHVYRVIEITGSSPNSISDAIQTAVTRAAKTLRNLRWFEVVQTRGHLEGGKISHYQVTLKIGFTVDDPAGGA